LADLKVFVQAIVVMKTQVVAGVIGAGSISGYHIRGYVKAGVRVEGIADTNLAAAKARAREYGIQNVFTDYQEMLEKCPSINVVSVCVPNYLHAKVTIDCLDKEKNVLCEKPPAINARETTMMVEKAKKTGKILMFDLNNRARPDVQAMFHFIKNGYVGRINSAQALYIRRCGIPGFGSWFTKKALSGGGCTVDLLHMLDLALYFMAYPDPHWILAQTFYDFAEDRNFMGPWGSPNLEGGIVDVETASHALILFKSGQVLFTRSSWAEQNKREEVSLSFQGTKAGGRVRRLFKIDGIEETAVDTCEIYSVENGIPINQRLLTQTDPDTGRLRSVMNFVNAVLGKEEPLNKPQEAIKLMQIIDAIYESARTKKPVRIV
jgi:predicted dehydrogenase